jgi:hypothetical protein
MMAQNFINSAGDFAGNAASAAKQAAGQAYDKAKEFAGQAYDKAKEAYSAAKAAYKDACPGTSFQHKNDRTLDGSQIVQTGGYKLCEEKRLFGPNDPAFFVNDAGQKIRVTATLSGRKKRGMSHKKRGMSHKKRGMSHKKRGMSHKKRGHKKRSASRK